MNRRDIANPIRINFEIPQTQDLINLLSSNINLVQACNLTGMLVQQI